MKKFQSEIILKKSIRFKDELNIFNDKIDMLTDAIIVKMLFNKLKLHCKQFQFQI